MSTHDIFRAKQIADRLGIMTRGNLATVLNREEIEKADLEKLYLEYVAAYEAEKVEHAKHAETDDSNEASAEKEETE